MILVPVIDLMHGQAVRATGGQRSMYRPVESRLCTGSDPLVVARALCKHSAARQLYVADLDALMGGSPQVDVLRALLQAQPGVEMWVDGAFADAVQAQVLRDQLGALTERVLPVFGSESLQTTEALKQGDAILSLDRRGAERLDLAGCWDAAELWPRRVIVMTLERVGSAGGPDLETVREIRSRAAAETLVIGAGGIRSEADLEQAQEAGAGAWLVASALHDGRLSYRSA